MLQQLQEQQKVLSAEDISNIGSTHGKLLPVGLLLLLFLPVGALMVLLLFLLAL